MKLEKGSSFSQNERLIIDGNHFVDCSFEQVQMEFYASAEAYFTGCTFKENSGVEMGFGAEVLKVVKSMAIAYRFGRRELIEMGVMYAEGKALELAPDLAQHPPTSTTLRTFRSIHDSAPKLVSNLLKYIRSEPQNALREIARVLCQNPRCSRISYTESMLPPGSTRSVQSHSATRCEFCNGPALIEDHGSDDSGRVWRQFADQILRDPATTRADLLALQRALADVDNVSTDRTADAIAAISPKLSELATATRAGVDQMGFLRRIASLTGIVAALLLTPSVANDSPDTGSSTPSDIAAPAVGDRIAAAQRQLVDRQVDAVMEKLKDSTLTVEELQTLQDALKSAGDASTRTSIRDAFSIVPGGEALADIAASESSEGVREFVILVLGALGALIAERILKRAKPD